MSQMPLNSYEIKLEAKLVFVRVPRSLLVFTLAEWIRALKRGKRYRRHGGEKLTGSQVQAGERP